MKRWMKCLYILCVSCGLDLFSAPYLYVANNNTLHTLNYVSVIDVATNGLVTSIQVPTNLIGGCLAITPDSRFVYANNGLGTIYVISTATNTIIQTITGLDSPSTQMTISPDGGYLYLNCSGFIDIIRIMDNTIVARVALPLGSQAGFTVFSLDGKRAYVTNPTPNFVNWIYTDTYTLDPTNISVDLGAGTGDHGPMILSPDGSTLYVSNESNSISAINTASIQTGVQPTITTYVATSGAPIFRTMAITPDATKLYIGNNVTGTGLYLLNLQTGQFFPTSGMITPGQRGYFVAISPDGKQVFTGGFNSNNMINIQTTVDPYTAILTNVNTQTYTPSIVTADNATAYLPSSNQALVAVYSIATQTVLPSIVLPQIPVLGGYPVLTSTNTLSSVTGSQKKNNFGLESELYNQINWTLPSNLPIFPAFYQIYRDVGLTDLAGVAPGYALSFADHDRVEGQSYSYYVVSVSASSAINYIGSTTVNP